MTICQKLHVECTGDATKIFFKWKKEHILICEALENNPQPRMTQRKSNACLFVCFENKNKRTMPTTIYIYIYEK